MKFQRLGKVSTWTFGWLVHLLQHNIDLSEYIIPYGSFDESFNYHKQSITKELQEHNLINLKERNKLVANSKILLKMLKQIAPKG